jgi:hypothetical protein
MFIFKDADLNLCQTSPKKAVDLQYFGQLFIFFYSIPITLYQ